VLYTLLLTYLLQNVVVFFIERRRKRRLVRRPKSVAWELMPFAGLSAGEG